MGARALTSRTALKIRCKSSLEYLGILVAVEGASITGVFVSKSPIGCLDNLSPDSRGKEESRGATEGAIEGATERCSRWECPRP